MKTLKILMLASVIFFVAGCKLAVIVVEGGEVQSPGLGNCLEGDICIFQVTGTDFNETFTAVPNSGWVFVRWNSGYGFFCQDSTNPTCVISAEAAEGNEAIEALIASSQTFYLMPVFERPTPLTDTDTVTVDGKIWAQVDLFTSLSWNDINDVCPEGICAGILNGYDMTGWIWASANDINALFNYYIGSDVLGPGPEYLSDATSVWAPAFFKHGWRATYSYPNVLRITLGWVSGISGLGDGYFSYLVDLDTGIPYGDELNTRKNPPVGYDVGGWFHRTP
jgi:hypothetical protein